MQVDFTVPVCCPFCGARVDDEFSVSIHEDTIHMLQCRCGKNFYIRREISVKVKLYPLHYFETNGRTGAGFRMEQQKGYEQAKKANRRRNNGAEIY